MQFFQWKRLHKPHNEREMPTVVISLIFWYKLALFSAILKLNETKTVQNSNTIIADRIHAKMAFIWIGQRSMCVHGLSSNEIVERLFLMWQNTKCYNWSPLTHMKTEPAQRTITRDYFVSRFIIRFLRQSTTAKWSEKNTHCTFLLLVFIGNAFVMRANTTKMQRNKNKNKQNLPIINFCIHLGLGTIFPVGFFDRIYAFGRSSWAVSLSAAWYEQCI